MELPSRQLDVQISSGGHGDIWEFISVELVFRARGLDEMT